MKTAQTGIASRTGSTPEKQPLTEAWSTWLSVWSSPDLPDREESVYFRREE